MKMKFERRNNKRNTWNKYMWWISAVKNYISEKSTSGVDSTNWVWRSKCDEYTYKNIIHIKMLKKYSSAVKKWAKVIRNISEMK